MHRRFPRLHHRRGQDPAGPRRLGHRQPAQGFTQNVTAELGWRAAIDKEICHSPRRALTANDVFRGKIIEKLMCDFEVDLAGVCAAHNRDIADLEGAPPWPPGTWPPTACFPSTAIA